MASFKTDFDFQGDICDKKNKFKLSEPYVGCKWSSDRIPRK